MSIMCLWCGRVLRDLNLHLMNRGYVSPQQAVQIDLERYRYDDLGVFVLCAFCDSFTV